mgnify:CR=1 FL=1
MDDEKLQKTIEFILDNQAQFTADIQELKELYKEAEKRASVDEKRIGQVERGFVGLYNFIDETAKISRENTEGIKKLTDEVKELREAQKETNERLNTVIFMFERFLDDKNGDSK